MDLWSSSFRLPEWRWQACAAVPGNILSSSWLWQFSDLPCFSQPWPLWGASVKCLVNYPWTWPCLMVFTLEVCSEFYERRLREKCPSRAIETRVSVLTRTPLLTWPWTSGKWRICQVSPLQPSWFPLSILDSERKSLDPSSLRIDFQYKWFGILLHGESSISSIHLFTQLFISVQTHAYLFYTLDYGPVLLNFVVQIVSFLATESSVTPHLSHHTCGNMLIL